MALLFVLMAGVISTKAQDGSYKVSESWSVTVYDPYDNLVFTRTGKKSGSITVSNGSYQLVNTTGTGVGSLDGTIQYDGNQYTVNAQPVLYAFAQKGTDLYAVVKLSFFVVLVPLPSTFGFSLFQEDDEYTATDFNSDWQGSGTAIDGNDERWDVSSTASFNTLVAQKFTVVVSALPSNGGSATGGGAFAVGSSRTVKATPGSGYLFADWTEGGVVVSTSNPYAFTLSADRNLVANFIPNPFIPVKGTYNGLFYEAGGVLHQSSGLLHAGYHSKGNLQRELGCGRDAIFPERAIGCERGCAGHSCPGQLEFVDRGVAPGSVPGNRSDYGHRERWDMDGGTLRRPGGV